MAATFVTRGYGQVEANRLTGIVSGSIEAQAPAYREAAATNPITELENGMFLCVVADKTGGAPMGRIAVLPGDAPANALPMLVFSEQKLYRDDLGYSDFVAKASDNVDGLIYPRLVNMFPDADVYTTNTINEVGGSLVVGDILYVGNNGYLAKAKGKNTAFQLEVVKVYTMPDGQEGVKLAVRNQA